MQRENNKAVLRICPGIACGDIRVKRWVIPHRKLQTTAITIPMAKKSLVTLACSGLLKTGLSILPNSNHMESTTSATNMHTKPVRK